VDAVSACAPDRTARWFCLLAGVHVVVWTLLRSLTQPNAPLDVVEMAYWGHEWQLGYSRHPPLAAWLTEAALRLSGGAVWTVYLVAQLAMVVCFWAAWQLGRAMLPPRTALFAAALLECCLYYNFTTSEVNNNIALYPFWALAVLCFYRALETSASAPWIAMGACLGLGLLAKYSLVMLLPPMIGFLCLNPSARRHLSRTGPYLALLAFLIVSAPHLYWAARHGFPGIGFALERTRTDADAVSRLVGVLGFARDQLVALLPMLLVILPLTGLRWRLRPLGPADRFKRDFLVAVALGPFAAHLVLAVALELKLRSMYGSQLWTFTGVLLLFSLALSAEPARWRRAVIGCVVVAAALVPAAAAYDVAWPFLRREPMRINFPGQKLAARVDAIWRERYHRPLPVAAGEWWLAGNVALYSPSRPQVYGGGPHSADAEPSPWQNPWTSDEALRRRGGIILWSADRHDAGLAERLRARFPALELLDPVTLPWETGAVLPPVRVAVAVVPPDPDGAPPARTGSP
jgi:Dolichyl-phosphate-mannose-protein mannosyltransferase